MKIRRPLTSDPAKAKEWQERTRARAIANLREKGQKLAPRETGLKKPVLPVGSDVTARGLRQAGIARPARSAGGSSGRSRGGKGGGKTSDGEILSDSAWRAMCITARGEQCRCCLTTRWIQMDHIKPKGQGGRNDVENGLPLCEEHHRMKTDSQILIEWAWLDPDQIEYLATIGWVEWDADGQPFGRGMKHFAPKPGATNREGGQHGE